MTRAKIIIDTDIGDDIDDAFAIAYAIKSGLQIEGITTVFRNSKKRAQMAKALLRTYKREDIAICAGIDAPLVAPIMARENDRFTNDGEFIPCQYQGIMDLEEYDSRHAIDFIIEKVAEFPNEIILIPIGPLTNIAMAIRKAPKVMTNLKGITLMGGYFTKAQAEWNILCDPEAARIVFSSDIPIRAVGLDVTLQCPLDRSVLEELKAASVKSTELLFQMMGQWFAHYQFDCPVLHDPLTIGTIVSDQFVVFEEKPVLVELGEARYGITSLLEDTLAWGSRKHEIAVSVDSKSYLRDFREKVFNI